MNEVHVCRKHYCSGILGIRRLRYTSVLQIYFSKFLITAFKRETKTCLSHRGLEMVVHPVATHQQILFFDGNMSQHALSFLQHSIALQQFIAFIALHTSLLGHFLRETAPDQAQSTEPKTRIWHSLIPGHVWNFSGYCFC